MSDQLSDITAISGAALRAQRERIKVIAENIANASTTPDAPGQKPYQRQVITFKDEYDKATGAYLVKTNGVHKDTTDFIKKYDPSHPAADAQGYVMTPNVNPLVEMMDMGDANRAYQANLGVIEASRSMVQHTISLLQ
jgi:flagellar basal-body rod protein FlgC